MGFSARWLWRKPETRSYGYRSWASCLQTSVRKREQFVLVNKAKPLPTRLINELLPEIGSVLPTDLAPRRLPSELCNSPTGILRRPSIRLIRRQSDSERERAVVIDTALSEAVKRNLRPPLEALSQYNEPPSADTDAMYRSLVMYWSAVREAFPQA